MVNRIDEKVKWFMTTMDIIAEDFGEFGYDTADTATKELIIKEMLNNPNQYGIILE